MRRLGSDLSPRPLRGLLGSPRTLRRLALASLVANVALITTGGAVRLTGSGLGCPTWPRCTEASYTTTAEMGVHGVIEFGNRTLSVALGLLAALCLLSALTQRPRRSATVWPAVLVLAGIPAQAVLGGITVLTKLNPWVVACHFLLSTAIIAAAYALWRGSGTPTSVTGARGAGVRRPLPALAGLLTAVSLAVIVAGTVVTGSGPHAGDVDARRTGLPPGSVAQLHADLVYLLIGLTVALWFALRATGATGPARTTAWLIAAELGQGVIGLIQYLTHLPWLLVLAHLTGSAVVWLATLATWYAVRAPAPAREPHPAPEDASPRASAHAPDGAPMPVPAR